MDWHDFVKTLGAVLAGAGLGGYLRWKYWEGPALDLAAKVFASVVATHPKKAEIIAELTAFVGKK
jgi:predicted negative regulator of RcsB-dependent stress response